MKPTLIILLACIIHTLPAAAQIIAGPMLGQVEMRTAKIWAEVPPGAVAELRYWKKGNKAAVQRHTIKTDAAAWYGTAIFDVVGLDLNTEYEYEINCNKRTAGGRFTTKDLWQWRKPAPDFSFLTGSCAYFNEPAFDRPGKPYGGDSSIFETMAKEKAQFMVWLGDNWYTREADYYSPWGLWYRAHRDRSLPVLQAFLKAMPHYAIWDDHDYGPDNADKSFVFKSTSRDVFTNYWANPSYGLNNDGIYTTVSYSDAEFFMMDDRSFRSSDELSAYSFDQPNEAKRMWGKEQMDWLKNSLRNSRAIFKFIVTGSQTLNLASNVDCLQEYPVEFNELMNYLKVEQIDGVVFLTGDRHHSEVIRYDRQNGYPLYDITSSPLTSGVAKVNGKEINNPARIAGTLVEAQNYTRISISGAKNERTLTAEFLGVKGESLGTWRISEKDLKWTR